MRSKLFVPATRPEFFAKAMAGAADAISFDLEDAVEERRKGEARETLRAFLAPSAENTDINGNTQSNTADKILVVRVNAIDTEHFGADMVACAWPRLHVVNLPKVESADAVRHAAAMLDALESERGISKPIGILANIESSKGLRLAAEIATAHPRVMGLQIGFGDLLGPLGISTRDHHALQAVRLQVRIAAGEAGVDAFDGAFVDIADADGFREDARAAFQMGYAGKSCIHPTQVALANDAFIPAHADIEHAVRVVAAAKEAIAAGIGAFKVDGKLVDGPFITRAQRVVDLASRLGRM